MTGHIAAKNQQRNARAKHEAARLILERLEESLADSGSISLFDNYSDNIAAIKELLDEVGL